VSPQRSWWHSRRISVAETLVKAAQTSFFPASRPPRIATSLLLVDMAKGKRKGLEFVAIDQSDFEKAWELLTVISMDL
jgi:hypothetical protein